MKGNRNAPAPTALDTADPVRNFKLTVDERIRALTIGVPSWSLRKRKIEDDEKRFVDELIELYDALVAQRKPAEQIERALIAAARAIDLTKVNDLVTKHNRYYPIEANLPMNAQGEYLIYGRVWQPETPFSAERLVARVALAIEQRGANTDDDED